MAVDEAVKVGTRKTVKDLICFKKDQLLLEVCWEALQKIFQARGVMGHQYCRLMI